ncbi:MAG: HlyC/CorC family transporter [Chlamydiae bacterium]|nr:HlyC/CorC family transporter [Chlamydiota bacterium]
MHLQPWHWFLFFTLSCLLIQGFFAMLEMASVSFSKVRLQYYVSKGQKRAIWLSYLLNHPGLLFGTTLIMVNSALLIGSECSRKFYVAVGLSPDWAPLTQVFLVLIFAEISPMFAGRRYAEHAAMIGVPLLYACAMVLKPFIWLLDFICESINKLLGVHDDKTFFLTREELQSVLEERDENYASQDEKKELSTVVSNIFSLKNKSAKEIMTPLEKIKMIPSGATIEELRFMLTHGFVPYIPIYKKDPQNIVGMAFPRDLLRLSPQAKVIESSRSPWFITEGNSVIQILKSFRKNNKSIAVVLNDSGLAVGILTLDDLIDTIFGRVDDWMSTADIAPRAHQVVVDKTFPGDMKLLDFNKKYQVNLEYKGAETLADIMIDILGHSPAKGESIRVDQFELTVEEVTLLNVKTILVRTVY